MSDLEGCLSANRAGMSSFLAAAKSVASEQWAQPIAPGKWSPAQIADHVAVSYEVAVRALAGDSKMGAAPRFLRPIVRAVGFTRILRNGAFPEKMKGPPVFAPSTGHPSYATSAARLEKAVASLESQARDMDRAGARSFDHPIFGRLSVTDYVRFSELHARHHELQLPIQRAPRAAS